VWRPTSSWLSLPSDWRKPDGLFVIQPEDVDTFLLPLPVGRLSGVGKVTGEKLAKLGIQTVGDLRRLDLSALEGTFGRYGLRLHELARGIDENEVVPDRPTQSISVEDTFESDVLLAETEATIRRLAEKLWQASREESRIARTIVLKLKTSEFKILTRSHTPNSFPASFMELTDVALKLRETRRPASRTTVPARRCRLEQLSRPSNACCAIRPFRVSIQNNVGMAFTIGTSLAHCGSGQCISRLAVNISLAIDCLWHDDHILWRT
jgi:nucleotidyltransferase/DNA polymerase involved in DNA repair